MSQKLHVGAHHIFAHGDVYILYDVVRGAFFEADDVVYDVLSVCENRSVEDCIALMGERHGAQIVRKTCEALCETGLLFEDDPVLLRPFVPPGRLEVVHLSLLLTGGTHLLMSKREGAAVSMDETIARQAVDLLIHASGRALTCTLSFHGGDVDQHAHLIQATVAYAQIRAHETGKVLRVELFGETWLEFAHQLGQQVDVVVDPDHTEFLNIEDADVEVHVHKFVDRHHLHLRKQITTGLAKVPDAASFTLTFRPGDMIDERDLPDAFAALNDLAEYVTARERGPWIGDFEDCIAQVYNRTMAYYYCGAGTRYLTVVPDGSLYVCPGLIDRDAFCMGCVQTGIEQGKLQTWIRTTHVDQFADCADCWARYLCGGGCRLNAFLHTGQVNRPEPVACALIRRVYELAMGVCVKLTRDAPERLEKRYGKMA